MTAPPVTADLPAGMTSAIGALAFTVSNPAPGGGTSAARNYSVVGDSAVAATAHPLVARYSITVPSDANVEVEFGEDTNYGRHTGLIPTPAGGGVVQLLVAGMKATTAYHMRAIAHFPDTTTFTDTDQTFTTGALDPTRVPTFSVNVGVGETPQPGVELVDINSTATQELYDVIVTDLAGNVIWFYDHPSSEGTTFPAKLLPNGHFITVNNAIQGNGTPGSGGTLREIDLTGATIRELDVTTMKARITAAGFDPTVYEGPHHDVLALPNGHFIVLGHYTKTYADLPGIPGNTDVTVDSLTELDAAWNVTWVWDAAAHLDVTRATFGYPDWTHCNGLLYSPIDHNLVVSSRHQSWVYKLAYLDGAGNGDVLWRLGNQGDFTLTNGTVTDWNYGQHNPGFFGAAANDVLAVWDNGNNRVMDSLNNICGTAGQPACYSRGVAFQLDEVGRTATIVFEHRPGIFAPFIGSIQQLANGHVEDDAGANGFFTIANINEVTNAASPVVVWHMQVTGAFVYRGTRIPSLYPGVQW